MPLSFMLQVQMQVQMQVQLQVQLQIRMKLTVLRLLLKRILLLIQITVLIMRIMRIMNVIRYKVSIIPIYFQGGSISGGSTFKDGSVLLTIEFSLVFIKAYASATDPVCPTGVLSPLGWKRVGGFDPFGIII